MRVRTRGDEGGNKMANEGTNKGGNEQYKTNEGVWGIQTSKGEH